MHPHFTAESWFYEVSLNHSCDNITHFLLFHYYNGLCDYGKYYNFNCACDEDKFYDIYFLSNNSLIYRSNYNQVNEEMILTDIVNFLFSAVGFPSIEDETYLLRAVKHTLCGNITNLLISTYFYPCHSLQSAHENICSCNVYKYFKIPIGNLSTIAYPDLVLYYLLLFYLILYF